MYGEEAVEELNAIFSQENAETSEIQVEHICTKGRWDNFNDYKKAHNIMVYCTLTKHSDDEETAVGALYHWMQTMDKNGFGFTVDDVYGDKHRVYVRNADYPFVTETELWNKWS